MRQPFLRLVFLLGTGGLVALSGTGTGGQDQPPLPRTAQNPEPADKKRDLAKFSVQQRNVYLGAQRAMDWLQRNNKPDGRFIYGFLPALRLPQEGDSYLAQAGGAFALGRAARFFGDDRAAAIAKQAVLTLLLETTTDPKEPHVRFTAAHPAALNRVAAAGMLVLAVHELPTPARDLLDQADQLANYLRKELQNDGSINLALPAGDDRPTSLNHGALQNIPGPALYGISRSQQLRPAAWKLEALRKGRAFYHAYWKQTKNQPMATWHTAAYAEAYSSTREQAFADAVFDMNDWLCSLQYQQGDPRRAAWVGGFMPWQDGKPVPLAPDIGSAQAAFSLAEACRVARQAGDVQRHQRYRQALEACLFFVLALQYNEANAQHFADWYRPALVGAFHASLQDGNLRLDYAQHALAGLVQYLQRVADLP